MDSKYGSFLYYPHTSTGDYSPLGNWAKERIAGYVNTLVSLGVEVVEKCNVFHVPGLHYPPYTRSYNTVGFQDSDILGITREPTCGFPPSPPLLMISSIIL